MWLIVPVTMTPMTNIPTILPTHLHAEFEQLLKSRMGLDAASIGSMSIERAILGRRNACGQLDLGAYLQRVRSSATELQALIEAVVVPETWFFREKDAFAALVRIVQQEHLAQHSTGVVRLLSLPCSTGEEAYSMAMALFDAGVAADRFSIDAVDISHLALDEAQLACYGKNSFRDQDLSFRERHFTPVAQAYQVNGAVVRQVRFQHGNIFSADFLPGVGLYDIIFCRNVLIYFDQPMQEQAIAVLKRLLIRTGTLFVASAEAGLLFKRGFESARLPQACAFKKSTATPDEGGRSVPEVKRRIPAKISNHGAHPAASHATASRPNIARPAIPPARPASRALPSATVSGATELAPLELASRMADEGRLEPAVTLCLEHVKAHGPSVKACQLLGLLHDARGDRPRAIENYRKVLYLDPRHAEALTHLAALLEQQGDHAGAGLLRARLERAKSRPEAT